MPNEFQRLKAELDALTKNLREASKATHEVTKTEKEELSQKEAEKRSGAMMGSAFTEAGRGAIRSLGAGIANPMSLPSELARQAGRAVGSAVGGVSLPSGVSLGPNLGGFLGEMGGAYGQGPLGDAMRVGRGILGADSAILDPKEYQKFLGEAERQRFIEQGTIGRMREIQMRRAEAGIEPMGEEQQQRMMRFFQAQSERRWNAAFNTVRQLPGDQRGVARP